MYNGATYRALAAAEEIGCVGRLEDMEQELQERWFEVLDICPEYATVCDLKAPEENEIHLRFGGTERTIYIDKITQMA